MNPMQHTVLLSFDVEEFDMPLEYGQSISVEEQMAVGFAGLEVVLPILNTHSITTTCFTTANFAQHFPTEISEMSKQHEIASHTFFHSQFSIEDLALSKTTLENITQKKVTGLRMPRMRKVEMKDVKEAGYRYDSSINPTWLPGRYNNFHLPRTPYHQEGMLRFPASVSPFLRMPLFWLSFKNLPYASYLYFVKQALQKDGYVCLYFHPWEFVNLDKYQLPGYAKRLAGKPLQERLKRLIDDVVKVARFDTMNSYIEKNGLLTK